MKILLLCAALLAAPTLAAPTLAAPNLAGLELAPRIGTRLPLALPLHATPAPPATLAAAAAGLPLVLVLGYYACPTLCGIVRNDAFAALDRAGLQPGRDYRVVLLSIDPAETGQDAARARQAALDRFPAAADARFLTADADAVRAITDAAGFRFRRDPAVAQLIHPAGLVVATADGTIAATFGGVGYDPAALRSAILRAGQGQVAAALAPVLLLCFHVDPTTGRYTLSVYRALSVMAALTVLTLGTTLILLHRQNGRGA